MSFNHRWVSLYSSSLSSRLYVYFFNLFPFNVRCRSLRLPGRSMFDVHFFQAIVGKNNLAHMNLSPDLSKTLHLLDYFFLEDRIVSRQALCLLKMELSFLDLA